MTHTLSATFRVVTPLFCGGADNNAELRLPSIKGCLRFWWRALAWSRLDGDLAAVKKEEDFIFGSASGGQSRVLMRLDAVTRRPRRSKPPQVLNNPHNNDVVGMGVRYLGYGLMGAFGKDTGKLTRSCLEPPPAGQFEFTLSMRCHKHLGDSQLDSVMNALKVMGLISGIGAKSRKGYGSLVLLELVKDGVTNYSEPKTIESLKQEIAAFKPQEKSQGDVPYTAFTDDSRFLILTPEGSSNPLQMLDLIGRELVRYRSWGHNGFILRENRSQPGIPREENFRRDHDLMKDPVSERDRHPDRIAFGLPHNYGKAKDQQVGPAAAFLDRRAAPLFIHIHLINETPVVVLSFFPTLFLPKNAQDISVGEAKIPQKKEAVLYQPVHAFLKRLKDPQQRREPFGDVVEVAR